MDIRLTAARRLLAIGAENQRARSIINELRPVYLFSAVDPVADAGLAALAADCGPRIARLEVRVQYEENGVLRTAFVALATAWPCSPGGAPDAPLPTRRFVTAGHVLPFFLKDGQTIPNAGAFPENGMQEGRVVFPDGRVYRIEKWISASSLDVAVFDIEDPTPDICLGLCLRDSFDLPGTVAPLGYPLAADVGLFSQIDPDYQGRQFAGSGWASRHAISPLKASYFQHDASTVPGYSGAPVFDMQTRHVIGVHVWGSAKLPDLADGGAASNSWDTVDLNDAVRVSALRADGWMAEILAGTRDTPPPLTKSWAWQGGKVPKADPVTPEALQVAMLKRMAPPRTSFAATDAGIVRDRPDSRDRIYEPPLILAEERVRPRPGLIGDQQNEGSCASFAVAAAIEHQQSMHKNYAPGQNFAASVRMLDRMARRHDEWLDDSQDGTSLRAVIKGFYHNGVCQWDLCPYIPGRPDFFLTREIAKDARKLALGSYLRVRRSLHDMRMAVQQGGAVIVTAQIHDGWRRLDAEKRIPYDLADPPAPRGLHAFIVDGYTPEGFIIQNSRGPGWGGYDDLPGHALWRFDDWAANCVDAWVIRLAPRSETAFAVSVASDRDQERPRRIGLLGHMLHAERDGLVEDGTLGLGAHGVAETAGYLGSDEGLKKYPRLLLIFHEPLLDGDTIARLALPLTLQFKARGIYPFHVAYGLDEMLSCRLRLSHDVAEAVKRYLREGGSRDMALVRQLGPGIRAQVENYRRGAQEAARRAMRDALAVLPLFAGEGRRVDMVSVGLGSIPARSLVRTGPEFNLNHLAIASPVPMRGIRTWRLAEERDEVDMPGWLGSRGDLIAAAHGQRIRARGGAKAATVQELLARHDFVSTLLKKLG